MPQTLRKYLARWEPRASVPRAEVDKGKGKAKRRVESDESSDSDGSLSLAQLEVRASKKAKSNGNLSPSTSGRGRELIQDVRKVQASSARGQRSSLQTTTSPNTMRKQVPVRLNPFRRKSKTSSLRRCVQERGRRSPPADSGRCPQHAKREKQVIG